MSSKGVFAVYSLLLAMVSTPQVIGQNASVLTWHNGFDRTGLNSEEKVLTPANVKASTFGKTKFIAADGKVDAQPLYVSGLTISSKVHNVVFLATEHDTVFASDADNGATLWKTSLLQPGESPSDNHGCSQITPEIGVTSTPVIDPLQGPHGVIYVVSMTKGPSGAYHQRIHALDLTTGSHLYLPTEIKASAPGTGDSSSGGRVVFDPGQYAERAALLEWNGKIYTAWTSHCDKRPYTGWIMAFDASTLKLNSVLNLTPNGSEGAVWMSGGGLAASTHRIFFLDGNGTFDTTLNGNGFPSNNDFGNGFIGLDATSQGLKIVDYYATDTTVQQSSADTDLGSGGTMVLPTMLDHSGNKYFLAVGAGKDTNIYLVNRFDLGKYHPNGGSIYQMIPGALPNGAWSSPAYFDNKIYYGGVRDTIKAFTIANARLISTPNSRTTDTFAYPGTTPSISSNGTSNGIVWAVENVSPGVLHAYNANDLSEELYNSDQSGTRDQFGAPIKFTTVTVANGHVYVPTQTGVAVFGLLQ